MPGFSTMSGCANSITSACIARTSPSADDRVRYQKHPVVGERILVGTGLDNVMAAVRHHLIERWDGTGYPDRLAREDIPFLARLVHVAEVYDVLTVPGRYRAPP